MSKSCFLQNSTKTFFEGLNATSSKFLPTKTLTGVLSQSSGMSWLMRWAYKMVNRENTRVNTNYKEKKISRENYVLNLDKNISDCLIFRTDIAFTFSLPSVNCVQNCVMLSAVISLLSGLYLVISSSSVMRRMAGQSSFFRPKNSRMRWLSSISLSMKMNRIWTKRG